MSWQLDGIDDDALSEDEDDEADCTREGEGDESEGAREMDDKKTSMLSTKLSIINTNARSLCPKITSLIDCIDELEASVAVVTETWLADGEPLEKDVSDLACGAGLGMIYKNRRPNARGVAHGGVAVIYRKNACNLKEIDITNSENFEVLPTVGNIPGYKEKLVTIACYLPPNYSVPKGRAALA